MTPRRIRVLYSFPHRLGAGRICTTAWEQVKGLADAGAEVRVFAGSISKPLPRHVESHTTLSWGRLRIPYRVVGDIRACAIHDFIVSQHLVRIASQIDIVHLWPLGALHTLRTAARLGIPTVLERPNAHTRFAYEIVQAECARLGVTLPAHHEHSYNPQVLAKEEQEYELASRLLCPSEFVSRSFVARGFAPDKLARHQYGFDDRSYYPRRRDHPQKTGLSMLFVGGCAPRKGLHYALEAWLASSACHDGQFLIAGEFVPGYAEKLARELSHPSVRVLGQRNDVAHLMRNSDVLVLPTLEEGSALVTAEARGSGCVLLVSEAAGAVCKHLVDSLVHQVRDVRALTTHIDMIHQDRGLLERLRSESLRTAHEITWKMAGIRLLDVYRETLQCRQDSMCRTGRTLRSIVRTTHTHEWL